MEPVKGSKKNISQSAEGQSCVDFELQSPAIIIDSNETVDSVQLGASGFKTDPKPSAPMWKAEKTVPPMFCEKKVSKLAAPPPPPPPPPSQLETLLRIDPASGKKPVPLLKRSEIFLHAFISNKTRAYSLDGHELGEYTFNPVLNETFRITATNGTTIGYMDESGLYNQAGELIAQRKSRRLLHNGVLIGYLRGDGIYSDRNQHIGLTEEFTNRKLNVIRKDGKITAEISGFEFGTLINHGDADYNIGDQEFSFRKVNALEKAVERFKPSTDNEKSFHEDLKWRLDNLKKLRTEVKGDELGVLKQKPWSSYYGANPLEKQLVALWLLAEDPSRREKHLDIFISFARKAYRPLRHAALLALGRMKKGLPVILAALHEKKDRDYQYGDYNLKFIALRALKLMIDEKNKHLVNHHVFNAVFNNSSNDSIRPRDVEIARQLLQDNGFDLTSNLAALVRNANLHILVRNDAIRHLKEFKARELLSFEKNLKSYPPRLRAQLLHALYKVFPKRIERLAEIALSDEDPIVRSYFIDGLLNSSKSGKTDAAEEIAIRVLETENDPEVKKYACFILEYTGSAKTAVLLGNVVSILGTTEPILKPMRDEVERKFGAIMVELGDAWKFTGVDRRFIPSLRQLLLHNNWQIRNFAALALARADDKEVLSYLTEVPETFVDPTLLNNVGRELADAKNEKTFNDFIESIDKTASNNESMFRTATYILSAMLYRRAEDSKVSEKITAIYRHKIQGGKLSSSNTRLAINLLVKLIRLKWLTQSTGDAIAHQLLTLQGNLSVFALRNLATLKDMFSAEVKNKIIDKLSALLIRKSPPYDDWLNPAKNPGKIITSKIYFQMERDMWEEFIIKDGFALKSRSGKTLHYEKVVNGVTLKTLLVDISDESGKLKTDIFKDLADPDIHYLGYCGHAGMGGNLEMKNRRTMSDPSSHGIKIIHIGACSSMQSYYGRALKIAPGMHFIGNTGASYTDDEVKAFLSSMNGIAHRKSWNEIEKDLKAKTPFEGGYVHVLPGNMKQFDYAVFDELDTRGAESLRYGAPQFDIANINFRHGGRLQQAVHNVNVSISYWPFFNRAQIVTGDNVNEGSFFINTTDDQTPLKINRDYGRRRPTYEIKVNAGYSHLSERALSVLLLYEVNTYFSKQTRNKFTKEDKLRGLLMTAEHIHYKYQDEPDAAEEMFGLLKERYGIPQNISLAETYRLQKAMDDNDPQTEALKRRLLMKIN